MGEALELTDAAIWAAEQALWTGDAADTVASLDPGCVMVFPDPVGLLTGDAIGAAIAAGPRWARVVITERRVARPDGDTLVLGYAADGTRDETDVYRAWCTSCWRHGPDGWRLIQHQQTARS